MLKAIEFAGELVLSVKTANTVLNCLIVGLIMLIAAFCIFLKLKHHRDDTEKKCHQRRISPSENPAPLFNPSSDSSGRATHISTRNPRGWGSIPK